MKRFILVKVPNDATSMFINNVGCLRYSHDNGRQSTAVEPMETGVYLEEDEHEIVGDAFVGEQRFIVIESVNQ